MTNDRDVQSIFFGMSYLSEDLHFNTIKKS